MICYKLLKSNNFHPYIPGIIELFRLCFTAPISDGILKWRYTENPCKDLNAVIALDGREIVGFIGSIPNEVYYYGSKIKAAMFMNMMTNPNYRGNGIFINMLTMLENELAKEGYEFIYSFPNNLSNHILVENLNWKDIYEIPTLGLDLQYRDMSSFENDTRPRKDAWNIIDISQANGVCINKGYNYLDWRYKNHPTNKYTLSAFGKECWAIYHVFDTEMNITEFHFGGEEQNLKNMIDYYISLAMGLRLKKLTTWAGINTNLHSVLEKKGFTNRTPIRYFGGKILTNKGKKDLLNYENWTVYMGDDNVY